MSDFHDYEMSQVSQGNDVNPFVSKKWVEIIDSNNGFYSSNNVRFSLTSLYNSNSLNSYKDAVLDIPIVMVLSHGLNTDMPDLNQFAMGLKNGYYNLIDSINIKYDGKEIQQHTLHQQFYTNFKMHTTMSVNDENTIGPMIGYSKDTSTSWSYIPAFLADGTTANNSVQGFGLCNNANLYKSKWSTTTSEADTTANANAGRAVASVQTEVYPENKLNKGFYERQLSTNVKVNDFRTLVTEQNGFINNSKSYTKKVDGATHATDSQVVYVNALIRLSDISSFFENLPLIQGGFITLDINLNLGSLRMRGNAAPGTGATFGAAINVELPQSYTQFSNKVCPFMLSPINNSTNMETTQTDLVCGIYIGKVGSSVSGGNAVNQSQLTLIDAHTRQNCRILVPQVELQPTLQEDYLTTNKIKTIEYSSVEYQQVDVAAGANINKILSESIVNPAGLLIIPMLNESSNRGLDPLSSPFTCEPATTAPIGLSKFNVDINGQAIYPNAVDYDYELFMAEIDGVNSINGNGQLGMSSGLVSLLDYNNIYKYYYVNLERRLADSIQAKSIKFRCVNSNLVSLTLHCFVVVKKQCVIDVQTGKLLSLSNTAV